jgi:hypothetical protein
MSTSDYLTYTALFAAILGTQLGTRHPSLDRLLLPVLIVGAIGFRHLGALPGGPTSHLLELAGLGTGVVFGLASIPLFAVGKDGRGRLTTTAGLAYAALWLSALAARLAFAYGSSHWFHGALVSFSVANHVPAATYAAAFVLMALMMVAIRTAAVLVRSRRIGAELKVADSRLLRRLHAA